MADINFMDIFFGGGGGTFSPLEKDTKSKKEDENLEWISNDFLDSILKCTENNDSILDQFLNTDSGSLNSFNFDCSSDSGLSYGPDVSPGRSVKTEDDLCLNDALLETDSLIYDIEKKKEENIDEPNAASCDLSEIQSFDTVNYVKEEEIECEEVFDSIYIIDNSSCEGRNETFLVQSTNSSDEDSNDGNNHFLSENSNSDSKEEMSEIVKNNLRFHGKRSKMCNYSNTRRLQNKRKFSEVSEGNTSDDSDVIYPRLNLTPEEQKLAMKEGIKLPSHYPLTKIEERELKRIRRKIRNKISAQDSRRRKKEYVDGLEERVKRTSEENADLMKRIKTLESQKMNLVAQVKKLQASLARCSGQTAPSSTCLLVFVMSLALILAPNLRNTSVSSDNTDDEGISLTEEGVTSPGRSSSRSLLFAQKSHEDQANFSEEAKILTEQLEKMQLPDAHVLSSVLEMLKLGKSDLLLKEHDYFRPRKRLASEAIGDESWPPPKILAKLASELKNIASTFTIDKKKEHPKEPVIIDLLSD